LLFIPRRCRFADFSVIRQQQRSEILICFLLRRQVFLKISFLNTHRLAFFTAKLIAFAFSRQQQRGEILICFRSVVKCFFKILSNPSAPADSLKPASKAFQLHPSPS
jgi:hypothetical protein